MAGAGTEFTGASLRGQTVGGGIPGGKNCRPLALVWTNLKRFDRIRERPKTLQNIEDGLRLGKEQPTWAVDKNCCVRLKQVGGNRSPDFR